MGPVKPTLFIGSSSESLGVAYAAQKNLQDVADVTVWAQGVFKLSQSALGSLLEAVEDNDFGLFVFGGDDITTMRGAEVQTVRDNVIFELGLFIGRLGRNRTFMLVPNGMPDLHLPTDLMGLTPATYEPPSRPERLLAALGPACYDIREAIRAAGAQASQLTPEAPETSLVLAALIPEPERRHLFNLADKKTRDYRGGSAVRGELRHLRSLGLLRKLDGRNIGELTSNTTNDLSHVVALTELGSQWVAKLRGVGV
jgi:hypothetical protein